MVAWRTISGAKDKTATLTDASVTKHDQSDQPDGAASDHERGLFDPPA